MAHGRMLNGKKGLGWTAGDPCFLASCAGCLCCLRVAAIVAFGAFQSTCGLLWSIAVGRGGGGLGMHTFNCGTWLEVVLSAAHTVCAIPIQSTQSLHCLIVLRMSLRMPKVAGSAGCFMTRLVVARQHSVKLQLQPDAKAT